MCGTTGMHKSIELQGFAHLRQCRPTFSVGAASCKHLCCLHSCACSFAVLQSRGTTARSTCVNGTVVDKMSQYDVTNAQSPAGH